MLDGPNSDTNVLRTYGLEQYSFNTVYKQYKIVLLENAARDTDYFNRQDERNLQTFEHEFEQDFFNNQETQDWIKTSIQTLKEYIAPLPTKMSPVDLPYTVYYFYSNQFVIDVQLLTEIAIQEEESWAIDRSIDFIRSQYKRLGLEYEVKSLTPSSSSSSSLTSITNKTFIDACVKQYQDIFIEGELLSLPKQAGLSTLKFEESRQQLLFRLFNNIPYWICLFYLTPTHFSGIYTYDENNLSLEQTRAVAYTYLSSKDFRTIIKRNGAPTPTSTSSSLSMDLLDLVDLPFFNSQHLENYMWFFIQDYLLAFQRPSKHIKTMEDLFQHAKLYERATRTETEHRSSYDNLITILKQNSRTVYELLLQAFTVEKNQQQEKRSFQQPYQDKQQNSDVNYNAYSFPIPRRYDVSDFITYLTGRDIDSEEEEEEEEEEEKESLDRKHNEDTDVEQKREKVKIISLPLSSLEKKSSEKFLSIDPGSSEMQMLKNRPSGTVKIEPPASPSYVQNPQRLSTSYPVGTRHPPIITSTTTAATPVVKREPSTHYKRTPSSSYQSSSSSTTSTVPYGIIQDQQYVLSVNTPHEWSFSILPMSKRGDFFRKNLFKRRKTVDKVTNRREYLYPVYNNILCMQQWLHGVLPNWFESYTIKHFRDAILANKLRPEIGCFLAKYIQDRKQKNDDKKFMENLQDFMVTAFAFFDLGGDAKYPWVNEQDYLNPNLQPNGLDRQFEQSNIIEYLTTEIVNELIQKYPTLKISAGINREKLKSMYESGTTFEYDWQPNYPFIQNEYKWLYFYLDFLGLWNYDANILISYNNSFLMTFLLTRRLYPLFIGDDMSQHSATTTLAKLVNDYRSFFNPKYRVKNLKKILKIPIIFAWLYYATTVEIEIVNKRIRLSLEEVRSLIFAYFFKPTSTEQEHKLEADQNLTDVIDTNATNYLYWLLLQFTKLQEDCKESYPSIESIYKSLPDTSQTKLNTKPRDYAITPTNSSYYTWLMGSQNEIEKTSKDIGDIALEYGISRKEIWKVYPNNVLRESFKHTRTKVNETLENYVYQFLLDQQMQGKPLFSFQQPFLMLDRLKFQHSNSTTSSTAQISQIKREKMGISEQSKSNTRFQQQSYQQRSAEFSDSDDSDVQDITDQKTAEKELFTKTRRQHETIDLSSEDLPDIMSLHIQQSPNVPSLTPAPAVTSKLSPLSSSSSSSDSSTESSSSEEEKNAKTKHKKKRHHHHQIQINPMQQQQQQHQQQQQALKLENQPLVALHRPSKDSIKKHKAVQKEAKKMSKKLISKGWVDPTKSNKDLLAQKLQQDVESVLVPDVYDIGKKVKQEKQQILQHPVYQNYTNPIPLVTQQQQQQQQPLLLQPQAIPQVIPQPPAILIQQTQPQTQQYLYQPKQKQIVPIAEIPNFPPLTPRSQNLLINTIGKPIGQTRTGKAVFFDVLQQWAFYITDNKTRGNKRRVKIASDGYTVFSK